MSVPAVVIVLTESPIKSVVTVPLVESVRLFFSVTNGLTETTGLPEVAVLASETKFLSSDNVNKGVVVGFVTMP